MTSLAFSHYSSATLRAPSIFSRVEYPIYIQHSLISADEVLIFNKRFSPVFQQSLQILVINFQDTQSQESILSLEPRSSVFPDLPFLSYGEDQLSTFLLVSPSARWDPLLYILPCCALVKFTSTDMKCSE